MRTSNTPHDSHDSQLPQSFYAIALTEADRAALDDARAVEGLAEEIALLRLRVHDALIAHRDDTKLIESGVRLLIQSLLAQRRISQPDADATWSEAIEYIHQFAEDIEGAPRA